MDGVLGKMTPIDGALYTVNPIAINTTTDVYTENKRIACEIESDNYGKVRNFPDYVIPLFIFRSC